MKERARAPSPLPPVAPLVWRVNVCIGLLLGLSLSEDGVATPETETAGFLHKRRSLTKIFRVDVFNYLTFLIIIE